jgi:ATP-dependent DNA helicase RecG
MFSLFENPTIDEILKEREGQLFDRKSAKILNSNNKSSLADCLIGFGNADGGVVVIGIEKDKTITGLDNPDIQASIVSSVAMKNVFPPIPVKMKFMDCDDHKGFKNKILIIETERGEEVYNNAKDEVYLRIGEETIKLNFEQRTNLYNDRGRGNFELNFAKGAILDDLDMDLIQEYKDILGIPDLSTEDLFVGRDLAAKDGDRLKINMAGILLFGTQPEKWVERARIRLLRYGGDVEKQGSEYNITKDVSINGPIIRQVREAQKILSSMFHDFTYLDPTGRFITQPEYPEFAWIETIVNAVVHRSYLMRGADIQIKMFDDRLEVISPGRFPGLINEKNIKDTHYSRNPRIAKVASEFGLVKELGEGVNRIIKTMEDMGLPTPTFKEKGFSEVVVTLENNSRIRRIEKTLKEIDAPMDEEVMRSLEESEQKIIKFILNHGKITTKECVEILGGSRITASRKLAQMANSNLLEKIGLATSPKTFYRLGLKLSDKKPILDKNKNGPKQENLL